MAELSYLRGAFIAYEPGGYPDRKRVIPFRFNPESLSRSVRVQTGQTGTGTEGAAASGEGAAGEGAAEAEQSADAASGSLKETFSVKVRLDFADRGQEAEGLDEQFGIAPEIAAIEELLYPAETESEASSDGTEPVRPRRTRPTVLFVWGRKRVLPVRITALTINEQVYNDHLNPLRAEVDAALEVMGEADARENPAVSTALEHTGAGRRELAQQYYDNTASQGSTILPI